MRGNDEDDRDRGQYLTVDNLPMLMAFGYQTAYDWANDLVNRETVLGTIVIRGEPPVLDYIESRLFETFCERVLGQMVPADLEFRMGFRVGISQAVSELSASAR